MDRFGASVTTDSRAVEILTTQGWLSRVDADFQQAILNVAVLRQKAATHSISYAGDDAGCVYGVIDGQVDFTSGVSSINAPIGDIALPGDWWGFRPLRGNPRAIHAVARTDLLLAEIPLSKITAMLTEHPEWWRHINTLNSLKQERWGGGMIDMTIRSSRLRCIAVLLRLAGCRDAAINTESATIHFTQEQLSAAANISRYPAGTILRGLAKSGHVSLGYGTITVLRPAELCAMVDEA